MQLMKIREHIMKRPVSLLIVAALALSGCTSYKKKFAKQTIPNIGLFADSTITMLSDLNLTLSREETLLARRFFDETQPEEQLVITLDEDLKQTLDDIVRYSIEIVNIAETDGAETNRVKLYADYLIQFRDSMIEQELINAKGFDSTIDEVRAQTEFIEALRKAQPLLNAAVIDSALDVEKLILATEALAKDMDGEIDKEYADIIRYRTKLEREKSDILTAFEIIYDAYRSDEPSLEKLRESGVIWTPEIIPEGRPTRDNLKEIGEHLQARMAALNLVQNEIKSNWEDYLATHQELDRVVDKSILSSQQARIVMLAWVRAHQKMASGTSVPADWFDLGEVTKSLVKKTPDLIL